MQFPPKGTTVFKLYNQAMSTETVLAQWAPLSWRLTLLKIETKLLQPVLFPYVHVIIGAREIKTQLSLI